MVKKKFIVSAIVRTKNSDKTLFDCLQSLNNQQNINVGEIIIVDSGSTDNTLKIAQEFNCKILHYPSDIPFNYSLALNLGIEESSSDYILIVSSHVVLKHSNTVELMSRFLRINKYICAVSTSRDSSQNISVNPDWSQVQWKLINNYNFEGQGMYNFCSLIRKNDWLNYQFNESLSTCEDQDWVSYFYKTKNGASIIIYYPTIFYNNPYYRPQKDALEFIVLGRYIYSYYRSKRFILDLLVKALRSFFKMDFNNFSHYSIVSYYLIKDRMKPIENLDILRQKTLNRDKQ